MSYGVEMVEGHLLAAFLRHHPEEVDLVPLPRRGRRGAPRAEKKQAKKKTPQR